MYKLEHIIRYLAGEASENEKERFEEELNSDSDLKAEFERVSQIWDLMKANLSLDDIEKDATKDEIIAAVMASIDVEDYMEEERPDSGDFIEALNSAMDKDGPEQKESGDQEMGNAGDKFRSGMDTGEIEGKDNSGSRIDSSNRNAKDNFDLKANLNNSGERQAKKRSRGLRNLVFISAAAALALLLIIPAKNPVDLSGRYLKDIDVLFEGSQWQSSRSKDFQLLELYRNEAYEALLEYAEADTLSRDMRILVALAYFEVGETAECIRRLEDLQQYSDDPDKDPILWYLSLAYIIDGKKDRAIKMLEELESNSENYKRQARKLHASLK